MSLIVLILSHFFFNFFTFPSFDITRMEKVACRKASSQAKVLGTIVSIAGAFIVTLYKGPRITTIASPKVSLSHALRSSNSNWAVGGLFLTAEYILVPLWYIVQVDAKPPKTFEFYWTFGNLVEEIWICDVFADTNNERVPCGINRSLPLQFICELRSCHCGVNHWKRFNGLESRTRYCIGLRHVLGEKLPYNNAVNY